MNLRLLVERILRAFWALPALGAVLAAVTAFVVIALDRAYGGSGGLLYGGGPDSARAIVTTVATSVLTFAGLAFSITIVALQLASSQFSPRVLNTLMRDRWTQSALAVFVGTFVYSLLVLRQVRGGDEPFVPGLGVGLVVVLGLVSIGALVGFIQNMTQSLRVVTIIDRIFAAMKRAVEAWYPDEVSDPRPGRVVEGPAHAVRARDDGVLTWFDRAQIVKRAVGQDLTVELLVPAGAWVVRDQDLLVVHGSAEDADAFVKLVGLGRERETATDPPYGFRQLVDIAERALSPGVNDPTTAVQCVDRMHSVLRRLATRELAVGDTVVDGVVRLRVPVASWEDYVAVACDEIRHWGADSQRVHRRMESMLRDLLAAAPGLRAEAVQSRLDLLAARRTGPLAQEWSAVTAHGDPAEWLEDR